MTNLGHLQTAIRGALLSEQPAPELLAAIRAGAIAPASRLQIYRNHLFVTLTAALKSTFPAVCRVVDERFFDFAAHEFIAKHPPSGPYLFEYGAEFPAFLAAFPPCRGLPYLADVAALEWAINRAANAEDVPALDPAALRAIAPADTPRLVFTTRPSVAWIESRWPIDAIWRANCEPAGADNVINLDAGGVRLEIVRVDGEVLMRPLSYLAFAFRQALANGETLEKAAQAALQADPMFDLVLALRALVADGVAAAARITTPTPMTDTQETAPCAITRLPARPRPPVGAHASARRSRVLRPFRTAY
jgi:Putative DNA-binding domain